MHVCVCVRARARVCVCMRALSCLVVSDSFVTPWTVARQVPLSMGFSKQEYRRRLPFPTPWDLPDPGTDPVSPVSCIGNVILWTTSATWGDHDDSATMWIF